MLAQFAYHQQHNKWYPPPPKALYFLRAQFLRFIQLYYVSHTHYNLKTSFLLAISSEQSKACLQLSYRVNLLRFFLLNSHIISVERLFNTIKS